MELRFDAAEIGCVEQNDALVCGASNSKSDEPYHYITIQGWADPDYPDDEHRPHFEIDDQINGGYDLLASCSVSRSLLTVQLLHDVPWYPKLSRVVVGIGSATAEQFDLLVAGLRRVFRDRPTDLHVQVNDSNVA
jgi:hypothetical protein